MHKIIRYKSTNPKVLADERLATTAIPNDSKNTLIIYSRQYTSF